VNNLHTFKFYTAAKVSISFCSDFINKMLRYISNALQSRKANAVEQLYPSHSGTYLFSKSDPETLLSSNKILIDQTATILMFDEHTFDRNIRPLILYLAKYCLKLPASNYYHHVQPGSLFFHLLETANLAAEGAKSHPELMMHTEPGNRSDYEVIFPLGAWLLGILHDIAKPMTDMEVIPLNKLGQPIVSTSWQPDEEPLFDFLTRHRAHRYKLLYRQSREYHQHDAYRVWFISKLLSFFPKETGMRDQLKHIIPIHAASKHPLNYIVKQADRISTKRDTQRYRPLPSVSNLAKAFVDVLQDYDTVKRFDDVVELPYFFSKWAIHITFPEGVRVIVNQVNTRYSAYTDIPLPSEPDSWANLLGAEHSLLVANQRASDYRSLKYPDINRYVYYVVVHPGSDREDRIRVISLSLEHVSLVKPIGERLADVVFESQHNSHPDMSETQVTQPKESKSTKNTKKVTKKEKPKKTVSEAQIVNGDSGSGSNIDSIDFEDDFGCFSPPIIDTTEQFDQSNHDLAKTTVNLPSPDENVTAGDKVQVSSTTHDQVKAEVPPPIKGNHPPLSINFEALEKLNITRGDEQTTENIDDKPSEKTVSAGSEPIIDVSHLKNETITPVLVEHDADPEMATRQYLTQIPKDHMLAALFNDAVLVYDDEIKIALWAISYDLNQYQLTSLFSNTHKQYQILPTGVAVFKSHLEELITNLALFDEAVSQHTQTKLNKLIASAKGDVYQRIFSAQKKRGYRFLNNDIACALLLSQGKELNNYFDSVKEESEGER
jgi:hypothetical protein|tara:strand:+ start:98 stop:2422 length:2325 start_codon:yes stop_codon:yes gene_type:complete